MYKYWFILITVIILASGNIIAQVPQYISYQGLLTDSLNNPKADGAYTFVFRLYNTSTGGSSIWSEIKDINVKDGLFYTNLGDVTPFFPSVEFDSPYWLGIKVGTDPEMPQRIPLSAVGYSLNSIYADTANYARTASAQLFVDSARIASTVPDNTLTSTKILNGTITRLDVEPNFIAPYADTAQYALNGPIQGVVDSARIAGTIPDNTVTSAKIVNGTITFDDINQNSASTGQVMKWNGSTWIAMNDSIGVSGSGTSGFLSKFGSTSIIGNSIIFESNDSIGIGTMNPSAKLHIESGNSMGILGVSNGDTPLAGVKGENYGGGSGVYGYSSSFHAVLGLNSNNNAAVMGRNDGSGPGIRGSNQGTGPAIVGHAGSGDLLQLYRIPGPTLRFSITNNGNVGIVANPTSYGITLPNTDSEIGRGLANAWTTYSSRRWKTQIETIPSALEKVEHLRGVNFTWKESGKKDIGLIAEEVGEVIPEVVSYENNGQDAMSLDYSRLVAVLIEAIKDLKSQVSDQQLTIESLKQDLLKLYTK